MLTTTNKPMYCLNIAQTCNPFIRVRAQVSLSLTERDELFAGSWV